ncbi:MAG: hypothetical protein M3332_10385, partial [Actinomycetota bacterium]|nr:hypothetical protein [Actinomycetota bacterium]
GFGSLEIRRSTRDGRMIITEPTVGRPNLQTALAAAAGVNLVDLAYRDALRLPALPSRPRREAIWIHETAFPRSVLVAARRRRLDGRTLLAALRTRRAPTGAFYSDRDPLPLLLETAKVANKILQSALITGRRPPKPSLTTRRGGSPWLSWPARFLRPNGNGDHDGQPTPPLAQSAIDRLQSAPSNSSSKMTATGNGKTSPRQLPHQHHSTKTGP